MLRPNFLIRWFFTFVVMLWLSSVTAVSLEPAGIATAHPLATRAGEEILKQGGNAFDVAVAISAALAVVEPYSSGIGGGGFWLLHTARDNKTVMVDGRERAPYAAFRDMYLDADGNVIDKLSIDGPMSVGIPGVPAGLQYLSEAYGRLDLVTCLTPAIHLARDGFPVEEHYRRMAGFRLEALRASEEAAKIFLQDNKVPEIGYIIKQTDLAETLEQIADKGMEGFYRGEVANKLVSGVRAAGGIWTETDLAEYQVVPRQPVIGEYKGMKITSASPPSSGGIALLEILNMLEPLDIESQPKSKQMHLIVEAMRRAYRDRAEYLGDTDYVKVPVDKLTSKSYANNLAETIDPKKATPSAHLRGVMFKESALNTTHFSVIDHDGNRVAATLSINYPFGSGFVPPGTGVLLNDEMDDFSSKPGVPNVYGLIGAEANAIAPGKRMLSSMSPTFLETEDRIAVLGTPGGSRIISMVLLSALDFFNGASAEHMVNLPRYHHQFFPDKIFHEPNAIDFDTLTELEDLGHTLQQADSTWGNMHTVIWHKKKHTIDAASDKRGLGQAVIVK